VLKRLSPHPQLNRHKTAVATMYLMVSFYLAMSRPDRLSPFTLEQQVAALVTSSLASL
jgi:hypothetical protein